MYCAKMKSSKTWKEVEISDHFDAENICHTLWGTILHYPVIISHPMVSHQPFTISPQYRLCRLMIVDSAWWMSCRPSCLFSLWYKQRSFVVNTLIILCFCVFTLWPISLPLLSLWVSKMLLITNLPHDRPCSTHSDTLSTVISSSACQVVLPSRAEAN